jgi:hypothetical protein
VLAGSLPEGDYTVAATGSTPQAGSEPLRFDLVHHPGAGAERMLGGADTTLDTSAPMLPATSTVVIHATSIAADCGDRLIVRVKHAGGTQTLFPFQLTLDIP